MQTIATVLDPAQLFSLNINCCRKKIYIWLLKLVCGFMCHEFLRSTFQTRGHSLKAGTEPWTHLKKINLKFYTGQHSFSPRTFYSASFSCLNFLWTSIFLLLCVIHIKSTWALSPLMSRSHFILFHTSCPFNWRSHLHFALHLSAEKFPNHFFPSKTLGPSPNLRGAGVGAVRGSARRWWSSAELC